MYAYVTKLQHPAPCSYPETEAVEYGTFLFLHKRRRLYHRALYIRSIHFRKPEHRRRLGGIPEIAGGAVRDR